jgi:hypothetical protein
MIHSFPCCSAFFPVSKQPLQDIQNTRGDANAVTGSKC